MEKIYMEEHKNKKNSWQKFVSSKSATALFVVAIVAIVTISVIGFKKKSYALPTTGVVLPDSFTAISGREIIGSDCESVDSKKFVVSQFFAKVDPNNVPVFCAEHSVDFVDNVSYDDKDTKISDYGLLYLMANLFPNKNINLDKIKYYNMAGTELTGDNIPATLKVDVQTWITQTAIWVYLHEVGDPADDLDKKPENCDYSYLDAIKNAVIIMDEDGNEAKGVNFYDEYIKGAVETAKDKKSVPNKKIDLIKTGEVVVTDDNKFYQSPLFEVKASAVGDKGTY